MDNSFIVLPLQPPSREGYKWIIGRVIPAVHERRAFPSPNQGHLPIVVACLSLMKVIRKDFPLLEGLSARARLLPARAGRHHLHKTDPRYRIRALIRVRSRTSQALQSAMDMSGDAAYLTIDSSRRSSPRICCGSESSRSRRSRNYTCRKPPPVLHCNTGGGYAQGDVSQY